MNMNQKIFLWGYSLGSAVATKTAYLLQDQVDGLIIAAPWDYSYRVAMELVNFSEKKARKASKGNEWNSADYAKEINVPTFIVHGTKDTLIPHKLGLSLFSNTKIYMNMLKIYREYANFGLVPQADDFLQKRDIFLRL